jgi:hypothetical protein
MRPPDARQRPSGLARGAKVPPSKAGGSVVVTVQAADTRPARRIHHGGMACGRGNGSRSGQKSTSWRERPERSSVCSLSRKPSSSQSGFNCRGDGPARPQAFCLDLSLSLAWTKKRPHALRQHAVPVLAAWSYCVRQQEVIYGQFGAGTVYRHRDC